MPEPMRALPGYKLTCSAIAVAYVLLAASTLLQGPRAVLAQFGAPEPVLASALFADFFHWVFVHMIVVGLLIGLLGRLVEGAPKQRVAARFLLLAQLHYAYLDLRTSVWGNGLYAHPKSLVPFFIGVLMVLCFLVLSFRPLPASMPRANAAS